MEHRRGLIAAPGGGETTPLLGQIAIDVATGVKSIRTALEEAQREIQIILESAQR